MMWGAIVFDIIFAATTIGAISVSLATGRLVYAGTQHITRAERPLAFWYWIAFNCASCAFAFWLTYPAILAGP